MPAPRSLHPVPTSFPFLFAIKDLFIPPRLDSIRFLQERRQQAGNETTLQKRPISIYIRGHPFHYVEITSRLCALLASNYPRMKTSPVLPFRSPSSPPPPPQRRFLSLPRGGNRGEDRGELESFRVSLLDIQPIIYYRYTPWSSFFTGYGIGVLVTLYIMIRRYVHLEGILGDHRPLLRQAIAKHR